MPNIIMLIPTESSVGLTSITLGVIRAIERKGIRLGIFKAIAQPRINSDVLDQVTTIVHKNSNLLMAKSLQISHVELLLSRNQRDVLMEEIINNYYTTSDQNAEVVLIQGLALSNKYQFVQSLNFDIAKMLNAKIVFVISQGTDTLEQLNKNIKLAINNFGGEKNSNISGIIINKLNALIDDQGYTYFEDRPSIFNNPSKASVVKIDLAKVQNFSVLPIFGVVPWNFDLFTGRAIDMAHYLNATVINEGDMHTRRVRSVIFCVHSISRMLEYFCAGSLLVIPSDRPDVLVTACLAAMNNVKFSAILLTGGYKIDSRINKLCENAFSTGLPVFMVNTNAWQTFLNLQNFNLEISPDDYERIEKVQEYISSYINVDWIESLRTTSVCSYHLSPPAFRYHLTKLARKAKKRIVLPEGNEFRTVQAAAICAKRSIATCVLLGKPDEIRFVAASQGIEIGDGIEIIDPEPVRENYVARLVELRKNKGMTEVLAREQLEDNVVLGTLMLEQGKVDGLVSGAVHTTANTVRPPLQLLKTSPGSSLISSVFFMLLPEQVYIYGDCAINLDPTAEQLAEIAIQSANSAISFGIEPRVAMLSYATGTSGTGTKVEKICEATRLAQKKRPDLIIDGPLQYDAAVMVDVAKFKAPNSPVAGRATVFIFPDLNTGNITYKAVQRSANIVSIGPMLQGMRKPVNDLSRGALIDDIVYTIALTAIQSSQQQ